LLFNQTQKTIYRYILENKLFNLSDISEVSDLSYASVHRNLKYLRDLGLVVRIGKGRYKLNDFKDAREILKAETANKWLNIIKKTNPEYIDLDQLDQEKSSLIKLKKVRMIEEIIHSKANIQDKWDELIKLAKEDI
jgi:DNA-binding IclR family transcriptional regulator